MPRLYDDLFAKISGFQPLLCAARSAIKGKRSKPAPTAFMANLEHELLRLNRELTAQTWKSGGYVTIDIRDPKPRMVSAAPFRDRVVHHALCSVVQPVFENGFVYDNYANRKGKGTHSAVDRFEYYKGRFSHVLRCDIYRYFPAIDHLILKADLRRRISCPKTLWLMDAIVDGSNAQEPVHIHYAGDDLFSPYLRKRGLPIGNLTSQFFANLYLDGMDHFIKEVLRAKGYVRYVDDFALFHDDPVVLADWRRRLDIYLSKRRLTLHPKKSFVVETTIPAQFLGYIIHDGWRTLPLENVMRFKRKLRGLRDQWNIGVVGTAEVRGKSNAWIAHASHANTWRLRQLMFRSGQFCPVRKPDEPSVANALTGAGDVTTIHRTSVQPTATGTPRTTETTTWASVSPARANSRSAAFKDVAPA